MTKRKPRCAVVGAANMDIGGFPGAALRERDSNPGRIALSAGGVGRNIACNLARLGVETHLVAALGHDAFARLLREDCERAGARLDHAFAFPGAASSGYLFIADRNGDMRLAVSDMDICDRLTPEAMEPLLPWLNGMDAVVLDCNLPRTTLTYLSEKVTAPLIADAVSSAKAERLKDALPRLSAVKPNALEAEALLGLPVRDAPSGLEAARRLAALGAGRAFVTLGEQGVCCADQTQSLRLQSGPARLVNATGAGDAFTAALAWAQLRGLTLFDSARAGLAAASIAVESAETVSPEMSEGELMRRMEGMGDVGDAGGLSVPQFAIVAELRP